MDTLLAIFRAMNEKAFVVWRKQGGAATLTPTAITTHDEALTISLDFVENADGGRYRAEFLERLAKHDR